MIAVRPVQLSGDVKGRGLVATKSVSAGTLLLRDEPVAVVLSAEFRAFQCAWCLQARADQALHRCTNCKSTYYCGRSCQRAAWPTHREECAALAQLTAEQRHILPTAVRLAALCLWRADADMAPLGPSFALRGNHEALSSAEQEMHAQLLLGLRQFVAPRMLPETSLKIMAMVQSNTFAACDGELRAVGAALYPVAGLCNHSCAPNAVAINFGRTLEVRALRRINADEEVCLSYIDLLQPRAQRRAELQARYQFECVCTRCLSPGALLGAGESLLTAESGGATKSATDALAIMNGKKDVSTDALSSALLAAQLPDTHFMAIAALNRLTDLAIAAADWANALSWSERALAAMEAVAGPGAVDAVLGLQRLRVAKLQHHRGALADAVRSYQLAADILPLTHGAEHELVRGLRGALVEAGDELRSTPVGKPKSAAIK